MVTGPSSGAAQAGSLPQRIEPMLAVSFAEPFDADDRIFEVKWDGIRTLAFLTRGRVRLQTRNFKDVTAPFADVAARLLEAVRFDGVVMDGELVSPDPEGVPRLPRVMQRVHGEGVGGAPLPAVYQAFDILYRSYQPLLREPLMRRKALLRETLQTDEMVQACHYEEREGIAFFEAATKLGLEGVVGKLKNSIYTPGKRSRSWLKVKAFRTGNAVVGGYTLGIGYRKELFGSLLLGAYDRKGLWYIGNVGGGFQGEDLKALLSLLTPLHTERCPFVEQPEVERLLYWCEPRVVVQVKYGEFTEDGHLRFPIFTGVRPDVDPKECALGPLKEG